MDNHHPTAVFDEGHVLHELKHFLPSQTPLKDFIHHNSLHAFQHMKFYEGIFKASAIFGFRPTLSLNEFRQMYATGRIRAEVLDKVIQDRKGENQLDQWRQKALQGLYDAPAVPRIGQLRAYWKTACRIDLDNLVQPLLFRILGSYLDQGIALKHFPFEDQGLLNAVRSLESKSYSTFFKSDRARKLLFDPSCTLTKLLDILVGNPDFYERYLFDQQFAHKGWSGMAATLEDHNDSLLYPKKISLHDVILLELLLEVDALDAVFGEKWLPLCQKADPVKLDLFADEPVNEFQEVLKIWQDAFEWSYYDEVLAGVRELNKRQNPQQLNGTTAGHHSKPDKAELLSFQGIFCIDERECSLRRHLEAVDPQCETLGCPGFFGVEFYFQPEGGKFYEKLCPAPVTPKYLIKEYDAKSGHGHELLYTKKTHTALEGFFYALSLGLVAAFKMLFQMFRPKMSPAISDAFAHMSMDGKLRIENRDPNEVENGLQIGFTVPEMATRVEALLRGIGLVNDFAHVVYVVAHGSSSANNPHHGAHDCGACSGRPGATNARVFAFMANHPQVRELLAKNGLRIPASTQFVGAMHDTAADVIAYYDEDILSAENLVRHLEHKVAFENALDLNAKERSRRFASINTKADIKKIREAIRKRSVSMFEPRPELGHGTNALCFVGTRNRTKGLFLDRRAFMNSYDYRTDPDGKLLLGVIRPLPPVCGGINLEYYFSRVDNQKMGAGTKLPHHVIGLIGVSNSSDGDLRPGLPWQMIEVHDPVRLLIIVEHYPEVLLKTIQSEPSLYEWFINEWVHLMAIHPDNSFHYFKDGAFRPYSPLKKDVNVANDLLGLIESAREMETNQTAHATEENLPVHIY